MRFWISRKRRTGWMALVMLAATGSAAAHAATRTLPGTYSPTMPAAVSISLEAPVGTTAVALEDTPPAGWTVSDISAGGVFDAVNGKVKWGPFFSPNIPAAVSYSATPPAGTTGEHCFTGTVSLDGLNEAVTGDRCVTATACAATRDLSAPTLSYCPGDAKTIRITLNPPDGTTAIGLEDAPPPDWVVNSISDGGEFDAVNGKVKWGPFFAPFPAEVSYVVTPATGKTGQRCFTGTISIDGLNEPFCGDECIGDVCPCDPGATIIESIPPDGVVDARQPHMPESTTPRQGIGSSTEPITIFLDPPVTDAENCFTLCETATDPDHGPNAITGVSHNGGGAYEIRLARTITTGAVTTIQYEGDGSFILLTSHPANANADGFADIGDVDSLIDYLLGVAGSPWGEYSEDIDHSGAFAPPDMLRAIDLLNGGDTFDPWMRTDRPVNNTCPPQ